MKSLISILLITFMMLASCGTNAPAKTTDAQTITEQTGKTADTAAVTTAAETEEPVVTDDLSSDPPLLADGFAFAAAYKEPTSENSGTKRIRLDTARVTAEYESTFYGSESFVKRDTHVYGYLYKRTRQATEYPLESGYYFDDFNGDRYDDMVTFENGVLKIYASAKKTNKYNESTVVYSQKLSFAGKLRGTGDFNGDGLADLLFYTENENAVIGYGKEDGFDYISVGPLPDSPFKLDVAMIAAGDITGDRKADIIAVNKLEYASWTVGDTASLFHTDKLNVTDEYRLWCIGDNNCDGVCDLITVIGDSEIRTYLGQTGGTFGPGKDDPENKNLYPFCEIDYVPDYITSANLNGDGNKDVTITDTGKKSIYYFTYPSDFPAYDYSTHIIKTENGYILYNGGRYTDLNKDRYGYHEGDHVLVYLSDDGVIWHRNLDAPAFYLGGELGVENEWWSGNTIEPEVIFVDGVYHMYWQCENYTTYKGTLIGADRIGYASSTDGIHFERYTERPVVINDPEFIGYDHEEAIYVADDPDGKCFWLYVRATVNNGASEFIRIRSADPKCFDYKDAEKVSGFDQLGNQTGYVTLDDGSMLFLRITFAGNNPTLQMSENGLKWFMTGISLAGVNPDAKTNNKNCYFCGFSTINGTGEIERTEDGSFTFIYGTCCSKSPVAPEIFYANIGRGTCSLKLTVSK